ncbi:hypothetical protein BO71DRAFT_430861 [Aspergillus ellipticus CBS 707.79]|uniref:Uncharacterized protein n=1 Tax=Aspergillus ellipticus CBS 707.79 TaxID=1448320 RepID=A0A319DHD5_9EURO|nr:hypothetical protein BO71DRAFT_430861 [Aspergillus ellipticus CBS 707.79]
MLNWALKKASITWEDFIREPGFGPKKDIIKKAIDEAKEDDLKELWDSNTGENMGQGNGLPFIFGENGGHRAAWREDGLVIDSSARKPLLLKEEERVKVGKHLGK